MLTLEERAKISAQLVRLSNSARKQTEFIPRECPVHPGEQEFDQDWIVRLVNTRVPLQVLSAAILAGCPEIFYHHVEWSVYVLEARGIDARLLYEMLDHLSQQAATSLRGAGSDLTAEILAGGRTRIGNVLGTVPASDTIHFLPRQSQFLEALLAGTRPEAIRMIDQAFLDGLGWVAICKDFFQACLTEVGRLWALHQISVAQEHMATAVAQLAFSQLSFRIGATGGFRSRGRAVVTGIEREMHQFGSLILADSLESLGWEIRFLGTALPVADIIELLKQQKPKLLCVSITLTSSLPPLYNMIRLIRENPLFEKMTILVGGQAFQNCPELGEAIGANGSATSLQQGLDILERWGL